LRIKELQGFQRKKNILKILQIIWIFGKSCDKIKKGKKKKKNNKPNNILYIYIIYILYILYISGKECVMVIQTTTIVILLILLISIAFNIYNYILIRKMYVDTVVENTDFTNLTDLYSVKDFNKRIEELKKEEGDMYDGIPLYDVNAKTTNKELSAGVEIITDSYELEVERRIRR